MVWKKKTIKKTTVNVSVYEN